MVSAGVFIVKNHTISCPTLFSAAHIQDTLSFFACPTTLPDIHYPAFLPFTNSSLRSHLRRCSWRHIEPTLLYLDTSNLPCTLLSDNSPQGFTLYHRLPFQFNLQVQVAPVVTSLLPNRQIFPLPCSISQYQYHLHHLPSSPTSSDPNSWPHHPLIY